MSRELFNTNRSDPLFIPKMFFNGMNAAIFVRVIDNLLEGVGCADEYHGCYFPSDREPEEPDYEGVKFRYDEDEIILSKSDFLDVAILACENYKHGKASEEIDERIVKLKSQKD